MKIFKLRDCKYIDIKKLRHYIFINPNDILGDINKNKTLDYIKNIHNKYYINGEIVKYHSYNDIKNLLSKFDDELCKLYLQINYNYPALLADIGRYIILYYNGGIYHDLKCISNKNMIEFLDTMPLNVELIGEEHPYEINRVRNTNIIVLQKYSKFLESLLQSIKVKLSKSFYAYGPGKVFMLGSGIYIYKFKQYIKYNKHKSIKDIFKYPFFKSNQIIFDNTIYNKNIKKWQNTYQYIFR